jgi:Ca2+-binding EF-hand superfamily protein
MKRRILIAAAAAAVAAAGGAAVLVAQPAGLPGHLAKADTDGNGQVSLAEFRQGAATMFAAIDSDRDGRATEAEMRSHHDKMRAGHGGHGPHRAKPGGGHGGEGAKRGPRMGLGHADADGDGAVTVAEFQSKAEQHFALLDSDKNGSITSEEVHAAHRGRGARH